MKLKVTLQRTCPLELNVRTPIQSLVGNEGLKSESIMNVPSGHFGAISREPGIRQ